MSHKKGGSRERERSGEHNPARGRGGRSEQARTRRRHSLGFLPSFLRFGHIHLNAAASDRERERERRPFFVHFPRSVGGREREGVRECLGRRRPLRRHRGRHSPSPPWPAKSGAKAICRPPPLFLPPAQSRLQINIGCDGARRTIPRTVDSCPLSVQTSDRWTTKVE